MPSHSHSRDKWLLAGALPFVALCLSSLDYFPMWDGLIYYNCALEGSLQSLSPLEYYCYAHPTVAYMWPIGVLQRLAYGRYEWVIAFNIALGCVALALYAGLVRLAMPEPHLWRERMLAVGLMACCPVFVSSAVQLNPDYAVLVSFLGVTHALARDRIGAAVGWGLVAMFCKETGAPLYCVAAASYAAALLITSPLSFAEKRRWLMRRSVLLVVPGVAVLMAAIVFSQKGAEGFWVKGAGVRWTDLFEPASIADPRLAAMLSAIFVLSFMWIPSTALIFKVLSTAARVIARRPVDRQPGRSRDQVGLFLAVLLAGSVVLLTLPRTFVNVRYHLPIYPLIFLLFSRFVVRSMASATRRIVVLAVLVGLLTTASIRSYDPVSIVLYKRFPFGSRHLYAMTSISDECCGFGRDQLVYNLEFTQFHRLVNDVLSDTLRDPQSVLAMHGHGNWYLIDAVDRRTLKRAAPSGSTFYPTVVTFDTVATMAAPPARIFYIELPNMYNQRELARWTTLYRLGPEKTYARQGYTLQVRELNLR